MKRDAFAACLTGIANKAAMREPSLGLRDRPGSAHTGYVGSSGARKTVGLGTAESAHFERRRSESIRRLAPLA
jgi:hypothetical protein